MRTTITTTRFLLLFSAAATAGASATRRASGAGEAGIRLSSLQHAEAESGVIHVPMERTVRHRREGKLDGLNTIGLGDAMDITYNVLVSIGDISTPLVLDTGSADLWVLSDTCSACSDFAVVSDSLSFYPTENLEAVADAQLLYGDSRTGTHAYGIIGADCAGVAGFVLQNQYFAAINDTNTSVLDTGSTGIFGLGFPVNSILWNELYTIAVLGSSTQNQKRSLNHDLYSRPRMIPTLPIQPPTENLGVESGANATFSTEGVNILSSFATFGPLVPRLVLNANSNSPKYPHLASAQFSVTLQRTMPSFGGNVGTLSLGGLPPGVSNASLAWAPVRLYTPEQNGVVVPEAQGEIYPYAWDVPLEEVYFDGVKLKDSILGDVAVEGVGTSALIDTGNSLIRGPVDVIRSILELLLNTTSVPSYSSFESTSGFDPYAYTYPCAEAHTLSFQFAGSRFDVDARDFGRQAYEDDAGLCVPNLAPTDPPEVGGYLYSWSLGEPFLRGVLSSFYYGNLTHPSADPPRIGFLSTVPNDTMIRLAAAVHSAERNGGFLGRTIAAPTGTFSGLSVTTDAHGVVQASESAAAAAAVVASSDPGSGSHQGSGASGASQLRTCCSFLSTTLFFGAAVAFMYLVA